MAVFLSKVEHMTHGLAGDTSLHALLDRISSVANWIHLQTYLHAQ